MRLPGTRYQEHGWEQVRKLLGRCSLQAFRRLDMHLVLDAAQHGALLDGYVDTLAACLRAAERSARAEAPGNSYGDSVCELALGLAFELYAHPSFWQAFVATLAAEHARSGPFWDDPASEGALRKKVNDMYAGLRDKVDADNYMVATGRDCSPNKIYTYRMLDTAWHELAQLFADWEQHRERVAAILDRAPDGMPPEVRQMKTIGDCKAEWIIRWSATQERYAGAPGPLHTRSKRFSSLKNSPAKIGAMLAEIGDYEQLSSNQDRADPWQDDAGEAALWLEDYWRVMDASAAQEAAHGPLAMADRILPAPPEEESDLPYAGDQADDEPEPDTMKAAPYDAAQLAAEQSAAAALSLPPRYLELARAAQDTASWTLRVLHAESLPIRLAVYHKLLGPDDDSYPDPWLDPATGALPTLQQLAALDGISMPTLRKRRNEAIDRLQLAYAGAVR